jgi:hypothetical protein
MMQLPFTHVEFFDVFAAYNCALWPGAVILWLATVVAVAAWLHPRHAANRLVTFVLAVHWAWAGVLYHLVFFSRINSAAYVFAALFVVQALLLVWFGPVRDSLRYSTGRSHRHLAAMSLVILGLTYPAINLAAGFEVPRFASFGVPCPTTLLTAGFLLALTPRPPTALLVVPFVWCLIGGSAALLFGVWPDLALFAAGSALLIDRLVRPAAGAASAS